MRHEFDNGKYAIELTKDRRLKTYRYGEEWRDVNGDNLIYLMLVEIEDLKEKLSEKEKAIS